MSSKLLPVGIAQAFHAPRDQRLDVAFAVVAVRRKVAQELGIGLAGPKQLGRDRIHLPEAVVAEDDVQILVGVDERAGHVVQRHVKLGFLARQFLLRLLLSGDVGHHRDRAARGRPATIDAIAPAVRRDVLEALAGRMAQAFHAPRDHHVHVAFAVVAMRRKVAQELRIGLARSKQFGGDGIHFPEAIVAEDDVQIFIGIDERARHVVERDLQVARPRRQPSRPRLAEAYPSDPPDQCSTLAKDCQRTGPLQSRRFPSRARTGEPPGAPAPVSGGDIAATKELIACPNDRIPEKGLTEPASDSTCQRDAI